MAGSILTFMLALFALSVPVAVAITAASIGSVTLFGDAPLLVVAQKLVTSIDSFPLMAVPFFILAGNLMESGGISVRLVDFAKSIVGNIQGGLACSCVLTCMIFAAVSGSSVATTFAIGAIIIPAMAAHGYPRPFAAALQATAAELGVVVPPSIPLILYGVAAEVSIVDLFVAGIGPGLLIATALTLAVYLMCKLNGWGRNDAHGRQSFVQATERAALALLMPVVVIGGIYSGVFTPTEASVVAVFYALIIGGLFYRSLKIADLWPVLQKSVLASAVIMFTIAAAGLLSFLITRAGVPAMIGQWVAGAIENPWAFLLTVNAVLFIVGMFIETSAAIVVLAPILAPVAIMFEVDPVHFGLIMVVNLAMGMITPPFGVNLFAACQVAGIGLEQIVGRLIPFILVIISCLMIITYVPSVSIGLLQFMQ
ncbi:MAG: TRAP transporter large permease [Marinobacter sp.]|uniref:TRAP transporter large permease n=1 Tax=Marinobacter sp. TaxID=50741 RepID=UPI001B69CFE5|nr:TRAP transporter large permease [Marinobacter sp.]MBQ0747308.1 TRAP transporter large permease [Marinobacter sp.]MBQ0814420.1 TRAP transporter large permease [Marinobacter sp.]